MRIMQLTHRTKKNKLKVHMRGKNRGAYIYIESYQ